MWCFVAISCVLGLVLLAQILGPVVAWMRRNKMEAMLVAPLVVGIVFYGGSKGFVTYPYTDAEQRYLYDAGSYVETNHAHIAFTAILIPSDATIYAYSRPSTSTNDEEWVERMVASLAELATPSNVYVREIYFEGAEDAEVQVFTDYTFGPAAHTNGVAVVMWRQSTTNRAAMVRTGIWIDGQKCAPDAGLTNGPTLNVQSTRTIQEE